MIFEAQYQGNLAATAALCIFSLISFFLFLGFSLFECLSKIKHPLSTVHFTKMTTCISTVIFGSFILNLSEAGGLSRIFDYDLSFAMNYFGMALIQGSFSLFCVMAANPIMVKTTLQEFIQDFGFMVTSTCFLQLFCIAILIFAPVDGPQVVQMVFKVSQAACSLLGFIYLQLFYRRIVKKLKYPRGNEEPVSKYGILCSFLFLSFQLLGLMGDLFPDHDFFLILLSRLCCFILPFFMFSLKNYYDLGLIRRVNGKVVYSRGYTVTSSQEIDKLTQPERSRIGVGIIV